MTNEYRLQVVMHFCFIFWFFFLIWKTFLFKFGLVGKLMKREFPILLVVPFNFVFFLIETFLRVVSTAFPFLDLSTIIVLPTCGKPNFNSGHDL